MSLEKKEIEKIAKDYLKKNPNVDEVHVTHDGSIFLEENKNFADSHSLKIKSKVYSFRKGAAKGAESTKEAPEPTDEGKKDDAPSREDLVAEAIDLGSEKTQRQLTRLKLDNLKKHIEGLKAAIEEAEEETPEEGAEEEAEGEAEEGSEEEGEAEEETLEEGAEEEE